MCCPAKYRLGLQAQRLSEARDDLPMGRLAISRFAARPALAAVRCYGVAVISVAVALGMALILRHYALPHPFTSFSFMAIAITSWYAGTGPGLLALVLSYLAMSLFSIPNRIGGASSESYLVIYGIFGLLVSWFSSSRRRAERLLTEARDNLELRVAERTSELRQANEELQGTQAELRSEKDRLQLLTDKLAQEKLYLEDEIRTEANFEEIVGKSRQLRHVLGLVETVAPTDSTALIYGETGTGKELIARAIHNLSPRRSRTFVKLNCAAIPTGLLESELFGHEKGAFTGAIAQRVGRLELANNGTLFLDEIGDIPLELQPKLLRVLQEREFERLGSTRTIRTDVRLIAATNRDLAAMVEEHKFRSDLFFRLNVFPVRLPALRERPEDIPLLVRHFAEEFSRRMNRTIETISSETMNALCQYHWPGNIRELQNVIERAVILSPGPALLVPLAEMQPRAMTVPASEDASTPSPRRRPVRSILTEVDRDQIIQALKEANGRVGGPSGAAFRLGLKRTTFITRMKKLGIDPNTVSERDGVGTDTSDSSTAALP
jgi:transcriptional regulator with GAF, ATPase, and Fis domain